VHGGGQAGVHVLEGGRGRLSRCEVARNGMAGVAVMGPWSAPVVEDCRIHSGEEGGVLVHQGGGGAFSRCVVERNAESGAEVKTRGDPAFAGCVIARNGMAGFDEGLLSFSLPGIICMETAMDRTVKGL
jgi:hypothetical protein